MSAKKTPGGILVRKVQFEFLEDFHPHPAKVADPPWMREWVALYDQGEQGLLKLDTAKIYLSPAAMLPT